MALVNILDAFTYKWGQLGTVEGITDDQWKTGWAFIGATPPSVEQFNKFGQIFDEKSNYLYSQLKTVYDLAGVVPGAADANSLRDSLRGTGLFTTAAPGTNTTAVATTAFVQAAVTASPGRLIARRVITSTQVYTPTLGTNSVDVIIVAGGGGGGGGAVNPVGQWSAGAGGGGGGWARKRIISGFAGVTVTVGAGGSGGIIVTSGSPGGASSFGSLLSATGGSGGAVGGSSTSTKPEGAGPGGIGSLGDVNFQGGHGSYAIYGPNPTSGRGGASYGGDGAAWVTGGYVSGNGATCLGGGGSGGAGQASTAGTTGGTGFQGGCIIEEFA